MLDKPVNWHHNTQMKIHKVKLINLKTNKELPSSIACKKYTLIPMKVKLLHDTLKSSYLSIIFF